METQGRVLRIGGSKVFVEVNRQSACSGNCRDCSGCTERAVETVAISELPVSPGDRVLLQSEPKAVLLSMFSIFILPLLLPIVVYLLTSASAYAWYFAGLTFCLTFALIWSMSKCRWILRHIMPRIIKILPEEKF